MPPGRSVIMNYIMTLTIFGTLNIAFGTPLYFINVIICQIKIAN